MSFPTCNVSFFFFNSKIRNPKRSCYHEFGRFQNLEIVCSCTPALKTFFTGTDWHAHLRMNQNLVTQGDMPRFILDSYEECRGPPRLFMLDKYGVYLASYVLYFLPCILCSLLSNSLLCTKVSFSFVIQI